MNIALIRYTRAYPTTNTDTKTHARTHTNTIHTQALHTLAYTHTLTHMHTHTEWLQHLLVNVMLMTVNLSDLKLAHSIDALI